MFADFGLSNQFLLPILTSEEVATSMIDAVVLQKDSEVYLPVNSNVLPFIWLFSPAGRLIFKAVSGYRKLLYNANIIIIDWWL
jgi:hypothetical protein